MAEWSPTKNIMFWIGGTCDRPCGGRTSGNNMARDNDAVSEITSQLKTDFFFGKSTYLLGKVVH